MDGVVDMSRGVNFLSIDLGPESGRGIVGLLDGNRLALEVVHRFPNRPTWLMGSLHWDVLRLFDEILYSLTLASKRGGVAGVAIDAWPADFGLLGKGDVLLANPYDCCDCHPDAVLIDNYGIELEERIFQATGTRLSPNSTLYQLLSLVMDESPLLDSAESILTIPHLLSFWLSGVKSIEFTHAVATQCYNPFGSSWAWDLIREFGIPKRLFPEVVSPATVLGPLIPGLARQMGIRSVPVIATASLDTASAFAAVPSECDGCAVIVCNTRSAVGLEVTDPLVTDEAREADFSNEGGVEGTFRLMKSLMGLWLVEESKRQWAREGADMSYEKLYEQAAYAEAFKCIIDPDHFSFTAPGDIPNQIRDFCAATGQPIPETRGEIVRAAIEGIVLRYRHTIESLEMLVGRRIEVIHIVGGGCQNRLLCRLLANATGRLVVAGPLEATAAGNILVQGMAVGLIGSLSHAREIVRNSFVLQHHEPTDSSAWDEPYKRFLKLLG